MSKYFRLPLSLSNSLLFRCDATQHSVKTRVLLIPTPIFAEFSCKGLQQGELRRGVLRALCEGNN